MKTKLIQKYWKNEKLFRFINGDYSFLQVNTMRDFAGIEKREYPIGGIDDCFSIESGWQPCTQDEFVQAYVTAINAISAASGIEHFPLTMEVYETTLVKADNREITAPFVLFDDTQNPE